MLGPAITAQGYSRGVDLAEIEQIRELAENYEPVLRTYHLNILMIWGRIAEVQKAYQT